ncbi:oxidoreductase [Risungbinella massiliensis]|uniref:oxidoreductase n=1 Tax=Risungbinella massiliensis TaxID=1329796 RepID=UPI0005CBB9C8|nr:oxidoreductase [Risungbinella massiliensis]
MARKKALVLGATGLIGKHLVEFLLYNPIYDTVRVLTRKPLELDHPQLEQHIISFDQLADHADYFQVDEVFCCLGTTMKKAQSKQNFRKVDYHYPLEAAKIAKQQECTQFVVVTSMGANPKSFFFYSKVKGELEQALQQLSFPMLHIFRPSLLLGEREEFRMGEQSAEFLSRFTSFLLQGMLRKYHPIEAKVVAEAMSKIASFNIKGTYIYSSDEIERIVEENYKPTEKPAIK